MVANTEILGIGSLKEIFQKVKADMQYKTAQRMVATAGGVLRKEAKAIATSKGLMRSGAMIRNIAIKRERKAPAGTVQYNLGVRHGRELGNGKKVIKFLALNKKGRVVVKRQNDPFYWWFIEKGHKIVSRATGKEGIVISSYLRLTKNFKVRQVNLKVNADGISQRRKSPKGFVEAQPFIQPALENKRAEALAAMEARLLKDLERAGQ